MNTINKVTRTLVVVSLWSAMSLASAQPTDSGAKATQFRATESVLQQESTNMPSSSPPVDRTAAPADPIPKATTKQQKRARFAAEERAMQKESTSMPSGSPPVNRAAVSADPIPRATTKAQKKARFAAEEKAMQQESTR